MGMPARCGLATSRWARAGGTSLDAALSSLVQGAAIRKRGSHPDHTAMCEDAEG